MTFAIIHDGQESVIADDDCAIDDVLLIRPGEKIPTDGVVIQGVSTVDVAMVTG